MNPRVTNVVPIVKKIIMEKGGFGEGFFVYSETKRIGNLKASIINTD